MATSRVEGYRNQFRLANDWLEGTIEGMSDEQLHYQPEGNAHPAGAQYCHHVQGLDGTIHGLLQGAAPLMTGAFAGKYGTETPSEFGKWGEWARSAKVDVDAARSYAKAVYDATDAYLATLSDNDLDDQIDLSIFGMGHQPRSAMLDIILLDTALHTGEISAIKGLQGLKGYPF
ncbi:MAG: DinB family protein [Thermomicrobiales bacterium]|nr:DinB family protein [Thermomicrobiales bacterium]